jgi:hypothetical protein
MNQMQKVLDYVFQHVLPSPKMVDLFFGKRDRVPFHYYMGKFHLIQHNIPEVRILLIMTFLQI